MGGECSGATSLGIRQHLLHDASAWSPSFPLRTLLVGVEVGGRVEGLLSACKSPPPPSSELLIGVASILTGFSPV